MQVSCCTVCSTHSIICIAFISNSDRRKIERSRSQLSQFYISYIFTYYIYRCTAESATITKNKRIIITNETIIGVSFWWCSSFLTDIQYSYVQCDTLLLTVTRPANAPARVQCPPISGTSAHQRAQPHLNFFSFLFVWRVFL